MFKEFQSSLMRPSIWDIKNYLIADLIDSEKNYTLFIEKISEFSN